MQRELKVLGLNSCAALRKKHLTVRLIERKASVCQETKNWSSCDLKIYPVLE